LDTGVMGDGGFEMRTVILCPVAGSWIPHSMTPFDVSMSSLSGAFGFGL
jgi:hypothetical protein